MTEVNDLERLKALRRIVFQLPKSEAENIEYKFNNGLKTGYATLDRPWEKYYSEYVKNFEFPKKTMYQCIYDCNKNHLNRIAMEYFGRKFTYEDLFNGIDNATKALIASGVKKGDIVTIAMPTTPEVVYVLYALSRIGAVANMIDPRTSKEGILDYTNEANSELFITLDACYGKVKDITETTNVKKIISISAGDSLPFNIYCGYKVAEIFEYISHKKEKVVDSDTVMKWNSFIEKGNNVNYIEENMDSSLPVAILHTGGTTGTPKGVLLSNDNFNTIAFQYKLSGMHLLPGHRFLDIMPPFIAYGVGAGLHMPFVVGMTSILVPKFEPEKFAKMIKDLRPNHMAGVPSHWGNVLESKELKNVDLSFLITPAVGGDAMNVKLESKANEFLREHNAPNDIIKGYGITEECSLATACVNEINESGSVGIPLPQNVVAIFDPNTGEELKYNEHGEVCISGPTTMIGYYNNDEATNDMVRVHKDGRRWIHTGDLGYMTENGMLYIDGRMKRMIIRNDGFKVFPFVIEEVIKSHKAVEDCMVVGVKDPNFSQGYLPKAHIILKPEYAVYEALIKEQLIELCKEKLPEYVQPVDYKFRNEFPYTAIGKVDFVALQNEDSDIENKTIRSFR